MISELVSIITPNYNSGNFVVQTISSVINQTYSNWELIITDDCSDDNSVDMIKELIDKDRRIKLIELSKNSGAAVARNAGIKKAKGKYIAFLDSDDWWHPAKLSEQVSFMEANKLLVSFTNYSIITQEGSTEFKALKDEITYSDIIRFNYLACSTVMYNQHVLGKQYMPNIRNRQDWGLWIKLINISGKASLLRKNLMYYRVRDNSISNNKIKMIKYHWYIYFHFLKFNILKSCYYLGSNIVLHLKNKRR